MKKKIKFNTLYNSNKYLENLSKLFENYDLFRQKHYSNLCLRELNKTYPNADLLLTHSATGALEIITLAINIQPGDEVILPSYTFVSTANAFALRGAQLVFVDIETETLGIDPKEVEKAITPKTKAIVCTHYGGHACKIEALVKIAKKNKLYLIEDAATCFGANHNEKPLGSFGDFGVISFDITKHIAATQGGLLIINNKDYTKIATQNYHIGTNRNAFEKGQVPYYEWVALGSKYQMPETNAAVLYTQLKDFKKISKKLRKLSIQYFELLNPIAKKGTFQLMTANQVNSNLHEFYIILQSPKERELLAKHLNSKGIEAFFHYIPLHNAQFVKSKNYKCINCSNTNIISKTLLRLPLHTNLTKEEVLYICNEIHSYCC